MRLTVDSTKVNAQPKAVTNVKKATENATRGRGSARGRAKRGRNAGRPKTKTADQLDAEMTDYFASGNTNGEVATNGTVAAPTADGDTGMDEISVRFSPAYI